MPETTLNTFPSSKISALAMLYLENQDLSGKSPEEILDMYDDAYNKIHEHSRNKRKEKNSNWFK